MSLSKYVQDIQLNEQRTLSIFKMIAQGVTHSHQQGYVHCDLKLDNVLVNVHQDSGQIKDLYITDFGLSLKYTELWRNQELRGSLPYMAPEMLNPDMKFYDKVDSWSLGVILYELLIKKRPYVAETYEELSRKI